ncbi:MAG: TetR/AcrR family transcriptional regulator [Kofleriaceae bacterium]
MRRRRSPEQARTELLDAAESLFRDEPPDQIGLVAIAKKAGVSHALITHYFGTYDGLVEAVFERRTKTLRDRVLDRLSNGGNVGDAGELVDLLFTTFEDPVHLRLQKWIVASERPHTEFTFHNQGLSLVADLVTKVLNPNAPAAVKKQVENILMVTVATAFGYASTKQTLAASVGREPGTAIDKDVRRTLTEMIQSYLHVTIRR